MKKRKKHVLFGVIITFVTLLLLLAAAFAICVGLAFTDNHKSMYTLTETDDSFSDRVLKGALFGREFRLSETQVNTYINKKISENSEKMSRIKNIRLYFHENADTEIYAKVNIWNHDFSVYARARSEQSSSEGIWRIYISHVKLGELPLPNFIVDRVIAAIAEKSEYLSYNGGALYVKSYIDYEIGDYNIQMRLESLKPQEGSILCRTNSLTKEVLKVVRKYLLEKGSGLLEDLLG